MIHFWEDYTVVAVDMRGFNLTSRPKKRSEYRLSYLVDDVKQIVDKLSYDGKVILVAADWGGLIAWIFAYVCIFIYLNSFKKKQTLMK